MVDARGTHPIANISWRRNLYALWIAQLLTIIGFSMRTPFLPFFLEDLGATSFESQALWAGIINASGAIVMAFAQPIWGILSDRRGRKLMVLRAMFVAAITITLMSLVQSPWHLLGLRLVEGCFTGTVAASTTLVASTTPRRHRGFALGMMQTAIFSGASIGPLFGGILADQIGFRPTFALAGSLLFISVLIVITQVQEDFKPPEPGAPNAAGAVSNRVILLSAAMIAMMGILFALRTGSSGLQPIMPLFIQELAGIGSNVATLSGLAIGVAGVTSAISAITLGRIADRVGHTRILLLSSIGVALFYIPMAFAQAPWHMIAFNAVLGIAAGGVTPSANAVITNLTPANRRGAIFGFSSSVSSMGGFVGPIGGAALAATIGIRFVFIAISTLMAIATLMIVRARRHGVDFDAEGED